MCQCINTSGFFDSFCKFNKTLFSRRVRKERRVLIINSLRPLRSPRETLFAKNVKEPTSAHRTSHISTSVHQHISTSVHQHISTSAHQYISTSAHQHISTSAHQHISTSAHHHEFHRSTHAYPSAHSPYTTRTQRFAKSDDWCKCVFEVGKLATHRVI